tara:strand:- start:8440 stop:9681 length:1242 start_codon:yes stop_codon:yes gene_type:complete
MKVWIVNPYGTLPSEGWAEYRSSMLARAFARKGHDVVWWISDFVHRSKSRRSPVTNEPTLPDNVQIVCLPTTAYRRNISVGRVAYEDSFGRAFAAKSEQADRPDLVVLADPSLFFGTPVKRYTKRHRVKLIVDVLDLWPEMFHLLLPRTLQPLGRFIFAPLYALRSRLILESDGLVAVTGDYRDAVLRGTKGVPSTVCYCGVDTRKVGAIVNLARWPEGWVYSPEDLTVIYAGTLGEAYDLPCVIQAVELLMGSNERTRFIFAGDGPFKGDIAALAEKAPDRVAFIGSVPASELPGWYARSDIGLCSYAGGSTVSMPLKVFDYLAAGLAMVGSVGGEAGQLIKSGCGLPYEAGNPESLAAAIGQLCRSRTSLEAAKALSKSLSKDFDSDIQYDRFVEFAERIAFDGPDENRAP